MRVLLFFLILLIQINGFCSDNPILYNRYIVIGENVNIRSNATIQASLIGSLKKGHTVKVIKRSGIKEKVENKIGEWVYIDPGIYKKGTTELLKGWVFDRYLAQFNDFTIVKNFFNCKIEGYEGDWLLSYIISKDGTYKRNFLDKENNNIVIKSCKGHLYRLNNIIIARDETGSFEIFILNNNNVLCSQHFNADGVLICATCK